MAENLYGTPKKNIPNGVSYGTPQKNSSNGKNKEQEISGYVSEVTLVREGYNNPHVSYFNFCLQTSPDRFLRGVSFHPDQQAKFMELERREMGVSLNPVLLVSGREVHINYAEIRMVEKVLPFERMPCDPKNRVEGIVRNVTEVKTSKTGRLYFKFDLQGVEHQEAICFHPELNEKYCEKQNEMVELYPVEWWECLIRIVLETKIYPHPIDQISPSLRDMSYLSDTFASSQSKISPSLQDMSCLSDIFASSPSKKLEVPSSSSVQELRNNKSTFTSLTGHIIGVVNLDHNKNSEDNMLEINFQPQDRESPAKIMLLNSGLEGTMKFLAKDKVLVTLFNLFSPARDLYYWREEDTGGFSLKLWSAIKME